MLLVGVAYGVEMWLLLEFYVTSFNSLKLDVWCVSFVKVIVMFVFPLELLLVWAFLLSPLLMKLEGHVFVI
mgnify:CR=1 FL=1